MTAELVVHPETARLIGLKPGQRVRIATAGHGAAGSESAWRGRMRTARLHTGNRYRLVRDGMRTWIECEA